jgi:hypothetical protein
LDFGDSGCIDYYARDLEIGDFGSHRLLWPEFGHQQLWPKAAIMAETLKKKKNKKLA